MDNLLDNLKKILTLEAIRNFFLSMIRTGSGVSSKRFVFIGGFFTTSYCVVKLTNAVAYAIRNQEQVDIEAVAAYGAMISLYTTLILVGYRKPDAATPGTVHSLTTQTTASNSGITSTHVEAIKSGPQVKKDGDLS